MTVVITSDAPQLHDKLHILREEAELLRNLRDQLTATNSTLQSERDQLLNFKEQSEIHQASCHYKIQKLQFDLARLEADGLSSSMIEDISAFDNEILFSNESVLLKMYEISEFERKQCLTVVRRLSTALRESIENSKHLQSQLQDFQTKTRATDLQTRQQCDKLNAEKSKLKDMLKSAKDGVLEAQSLDSQRKERIYELETELEILKQQINEFHKEKLDKEVPQLKDQLEESSRENNELKKQLSRLRSVELGNTKLKEKVNRMKSSHSRSMGESIGRIKLAINNCDEILKRKSTRKPNIQVSSTVYDEREESAEEIPEEYQLETSENFEDSEKASKKDPNWSDLEENARCKKVSKKRKRQTQNENVAAESGLSNNLKSSQPRKLFADRAKSKMFTNSPGLSSVDNPFTDMLQFSGSVASIKDKNKRSRTRCVQKVELSQPMQ